MEGTQCNNCKNYISDLKCVAFLNGIPYDILSGEKSHDEVMPNQDNKVIFEPIKTDNE